MKQVLITIDTEVGELALHMPQAFETFVEGKIGDEVYGTTRIMDMLEAVGAPGEFFVDVYPIRQVGEAALAGMCRSITERGHAVQLHTHPSSAFDAQRRYFSDYSPGEQDDIIATGVAAITKWTGKAPLAHRAGGYGMNEAGVQALQRAGIAYDSSYHRDNPHCLLPHVTSNAPYRMGKLWQVPVTGYLQRTTLHVAGVPLARREAFQKLDFRYGSSSAEIREAIAKSPEDSVHVIFLHSFNFLMLEYNSATKQFAPIKPQPELVAEFAHLLQWIKEEPSCTFSSFATLDLKEHMEDVVPTVTTQRSVFPLLRAAWLARRGIITA